MVEASQDFSAPSAFWPTFRDQQTIAGIKLFDRLCCNLWRLTREAANRVSWLVTLPRDQAVRGQIGPPQPEPRRQAQTRAQRCGPRLECHA
jgi:hypothetical protein